MEKILETAGRLLGADYGLYNIIEEDQSRSQRAWKATTGFFEGFPWTDPLDHYGTPWEPMILTDLGAAAHTLHPALRELDIDTYIGYPIHVHGQLRGSFSLLYKKGKALNRQERAVLNTFARAFCVEVEREISEGQLRRLTAQQDLILATVPVQIWSLDRPDHIQFGNRAFAQFHGLATQQVTDISVDQIYPPRERVQVRNHNQSLLATGQRWRGEYATPDGHGGTRWLDVTKIPLTEGGAQQLICIATEITDRKRLEAVLQADLNRARRIHNTFLPRSFPKIPGLSIAAYYQPTAQLGGDYYDVRSLGSEHLIYLLDISGHGLDGALCSVFVRQTIRNYIDQVGSFHLPSILTHLQQVFAGAGFPGDYFITIQLLLLQGYQIQYTSAGMIHPPLSSHKGAYPLEPGPLISHFAVDVDYKVHQATIEPGETLLFYTDGVVEQRDQGGKMFGPEGILRAMEGGGDPQSCLQKVVKELKIHGGRDSFTDDISLLAIQRKE
ncbi:MAG: GAF domain-containing SpoIIE family protein phosphatase [Limnochordia bacterium]